MTVSALPFKAVLLACDNGHYEATTKDNLKHVPHGGSGLVCRRCRGALTLVKTVTIWPGGETVIGQRFNLLTVIGPAEKAGHSHPRVMVRCDCGTEKAVITYHLVTNQTKSCGCLRRLSRPKQIEAATRHGLWQHPLYRVWNAMLQRCNNPSQKSWKNYGGRGITVCERWLSIENFIADMGERPPDPLDWHGKKVYWSIDRIDNDGNYEPGNVRWATPHQQRVNRRRKVAQ